MQFQQQLRELDIDPSKYLDDVKKAARHTGYNADDVEFSENNIHKIKIRTPDGKIRRFGRVGYNDFWIWRALEAQGKVRPGYARMKRNVFRRSHEAISWKHQQFDPYAPNNLALNILW